MTLRVPYVSDENIERDAEALLAQYAHAKGVEVRAPIPIEDIIDEGFEALHAGTKMKVLVDPTI